MTTRLFHISDVHFGVEDRAALDAVVRAVADEKPDALVVTGDLTQRAKHSEYAAAAQWFGALELPIVLEPGNHDMPYYNLLERFTDPYRRFRRLQKAVGATFATKDVVLVSLKSTVRAQARFPWSDGFVTSKALRRTVGHLEQLKGDPRHVIVTAHHPLLGPEGVRRNPTIGGERAFSALAAAGADAVLTGHVHHPFDEVRKCASGAIRMIGAGTLSTRLRHGAPPSYRLITAGLGEPLEVELRELPIPA
ncbi:MAG: metallophosphoesterase [Pseudomonadota bacterium]